MTKNNKYLSNVIACYSHVPSCKRGRVDGGLNSVFGHLSFYLSIYTKNYSKIKTSFYFAFSSFALQAFTILYFSYL